MDLRIKLILFLLLNISFCQLSVGKAVSNAANNEKECDLLIKRMKRETDRALDDDDAYIEQLIKSTLHKEKQKCMEKYHLLEMPRQLEEDTQIKELRHEVAKLKDLISVVKDQRYILDTLDNSIHNPTSKALTDEDSEIEEVRKELTKMRKELLHSQHENDNSTPHIDQSSKISAQLTKQQSEINDLKNLLQGVLLELKVSKPKPKSITHEQPEMSTMLKELNALQKKLSAIQSKSKNGSIESTASEVVGLPQNLRESSNSDVPSKLNQNQNPTVTSQRSSESRLAERKADDELMDLLNALVPKKSESSIETLLKSLDADSSDDELEKRLLNLENQMKHKKKLQFEKKLKSLEKQLSGAESKSDDLDLSSTDELKKVLIKMILKKNKEAQSKSLGDDTILEELKELQKSIKTMSTDDDDLFDNLEEKNGQLDVTIDKLINAGGNGGGGNKRRKLSAAQIQALRRRLMAMKNGNSDGFGSNNDVFDSGHYSNGNGNGDNFDIGHGNDYGPHWHIMPNGNGYDMSGSYGHSDFPSGYGQSSYGSYNGKGYFHQGQGQSYSGYDNGGGVPYAGYSGPIPTNQFGTPLYSGYQPISNGYPIYPNTLHPYSSGSSYGPGKYLNYPKGYSNMYSSPSAINTNVQGYGANNGIINTPGNYQFFPTAHEGPENNYNPQSNAGTTNSVQSYSNQPQPNAIGSSSVGDLKHQIYDLQGVINTFNKPEYLQKPEDKETVYNLNKQINELKGVVSNLQEPTYDHNSPHINGDNGAGNYAIEHDNYTPPVNIPNDHPIYTPGPPAPPSSQQNPNSGPPAYPPETPHARSFMEETYRKKRSITNRNEEALHTLALLIGNALNLGIDEDSEERTPTPPAFQEINEKLADVRKQLGNFRQQHLQGPTVPLLKPALREDRVPSFMKIPLPQRRNNDDYGESYNNYYDSYNKDKDIVKKDKKADIFDKIFDKIIDKVIDKIKKIFPKLIEVIFGKLEYTSYDNDYGSYGKGYGGGNELIETFHSMGLSGILPLIITKILSKIQYVFYYLQKNKFFKTFLVPAVMVLLAAGAIIFLVWWLQPNDDYNYKEISYDNGQQDYSYNTMYRNSQQQEVALHPMPNEKTFDFRPKSYPYYKSDKQPVSQSKFYNPQHFKDYYKHTFVY